MTLSAGEAEQLNTIPITGWSFIDQHPVNGERYIYYATAVGAGPTESVHSNLAPAKIPFL